MSRQSKNQRQSELKCPSCQNWYDETIRVPKLTFCQHNVCSTCVSNLIGEQVYGAGSQQSYIPTGRMFNCPVCYTNVMTDGLQTNRTLSDKISAMTALESMIYTEPNELPVSKPRQPSQPQPALSYEARQASQTQPQLDAKGLGWTVPTDKPQPEIPQPQYDGQLGWTYPGAPPSEGFPGNLQGQPQSMMPPQHMPQPQGGSYPYQYSGPPY